ncbi:MAG: coproporphyrinogen III oxidase, partial [Chloroflexota bacterium]
EPTGDDHLPPRRGAQAWRARAAAQQDEDTAADMYEIADETFAAAGLDWYELSNWSLPGKASRHNITYWSGAAWEAVGPGAHAYDGERTRRWNLARLDTYLSALSAGRLPPDSFETTTDETVKAELAILALRTELGLRRQQLEQSELSAVLDWGIDQRLLESDESAVRLTRRGRLLSNELFARMLPTT